MFDTRTVHVLVEGRVQGVGYRAFVERLAANAGLTGWVRNRRTGGVEIVIGGRPRAVADAIEVFRKGPPHAAVANLYMIADVADGSLGHFATFDVRPTI